VLSLSFIRHLILRVTSLLAGLAGLAQINAIPDGNFEVKAEHVWGIDKFETLYLSTEDQSFLRVSKDTTITYANFQLGKIASANTFNPLKINLFYRDFNTAVILDNRLAELQRIDFNLIQPYRNVTFVSTGYDNTLWIYNQDLQILELFDHRSNSTRTKTVPIPDEVLDLKSDYNNCYLLTEQYLYIYSYFGNLESKHPNNGYTQMAFSESNLVLQSPEAYFFYSKKRDEILPIEGQDLLINQFLVTNETLYLYQNNRLYRYQLKTN
jgi:hypothetical protein